MNRSQKAFLNISAQLLLQIVTAVCGFIVPKLMLEAFGAAAYGTIASITQFLGVITLVESGVGAVVRSQLYKPLAERDMAILSGVVNAAEAFFRRIALIFIAYCALLAAVFPFMTDNQFGYLFNASLVLIVGISTFLQYYFGVTYTVLFTADQKVYVSSLAQIVTVVLNAVFVLLLIRLETPLHLVKLGSALIYFLKPLFLNRWGRKQYKIDCRAEKLALSQRWDNFGQTVALYVHTKTDYIVLTFCGGVLEIAVYAVYALITASLSTLLQSLSQGFVHALGSMRANQEDKRFQEVFDVYGMVNMTLTLMLYTVALVMMAPFLTIYTANLKDTNYIRPVFGLLLILGEAVYCLRFPYYQMAMVVGHFRQIRKGSYLEAALNIVISILLVRSYGITGVAAGTLAAMIYRTADIVDYSSKYVIGISPLRFYRQLAIYLTASLLSYGLSRLTAWEVYSYTAWVGRACFTTVLTGAVFFLFNLLFFRSELAGLLQIGRNLVRKKNTD